MIFSGLFLTKVTYNNYNRGEMVVFFLMFTILCIGEFLIFLYFTITADTVL